MVKIGAHLRKLTQN